MENNEQLKCRVCGSTDFEFLNNSNVHSSWLTGRTITTNGIITTVCKKCGHTEPLTTMKLSDKQIKRNQLAFSIVMIGFMLFCVYIFYKIYSTS